MIPQGVLTYDSVTPIYKGFTVEFTTTTPSQLIVLPFLQHGSDGPLNYDCIINWGDGSPTSHAVAYNDMNRVHTYLVPGIYQVEIRGRMEGWSFNNSAYCHLCTDIIYWGDTAVFEGFKYLAYGFYNCVNLKSLGTGRIPASGTGVLSDGFRATFMHCELVTNIPKYLFNNHPNVTDNAFYNVFAFTAITRIPRHLFDVHVLARDSAFGAAFANNPYLSIIPPDLFKYNVNVRHDGFRGTFEICPSLYLVPMFLHRYNTQCDTFIGEFATCENLTLNPWIFYAPGEETTRFASLSTSVSFGSFFDILVFSGMQGTAPALWTCTYPVGFPPVSSSCFGGPGNSIASLSNYASIPSGWK